MSKKIEQQLEVAAEGDVVFVDGPDGMTGSMSPEAALASGRGLEKKAIEALKASKHSRKQAQSPE